VHFLDARLFHEPSDVVGVDPATWQDRDPPFGLNNQPPNLLGALRRRRGATRGQHAIDAEADEPLQRVGAIREDVECTMERHGERSSGGDKVARAIEAQVSCHDAVRARTLGTRDLLEHRAMLGIGVGEIARAGTHEDENRNRKLHLTEVQVGSRPAVGEVGAQLEAVGAPHDSRKRGVQRLHGCLDENRHVGGYIIRHMVFSKVVTPVGELVLTASDTALTGVFFPTSRRGPAPTHQAGWVEAGTEGPAAEILTRARQQLEEYFARKRTTFELPLEALGSAFEHRVWNALRQIPYGSTTSYGALAKLLGDKHATRAVGLANGKNPIPIIVPCHRVVGSKGELTGFGGGLDTKRWLLEHEGALMELGV
jgi:methylated-DNA-[protein]-cysteine S-methyltransferase